MACRLAKTAAASQKLQKTAEKWRLGGHNFWHIIRYLCVGATHPSSNRWIEKRKFQSSQPIGVYHVHLCKTHSYVREGRYAVFVVSTLKAHHSRTSKYNLLKTLWKHFWYENTIKMLEACVDHHGDHLVASHGVYKRCNSKTLHAYFKILN